MSSLNHEVRDEAINPGGGQENSQDAESTNQ
jgi:hypothetical protein